MKFPRLPSVNFTRGIIINHIRNNASTGLTISEDSLIYLFTLVSKVLYTFLGEVISKFSVEQ